MGQRLKVFIMGGENDGWALDTEVRLAAKALEGLVELVDDIDKADVVHTVWPEQILENVRFKALQKGTPIVASFSNDPIALFEKVPGLHACAERWFCVGQSLGAVKKLEATQIPFVRYVPYAADLDTFKDLEPQASELSELRKQLGLPSGKYVLGSFQRDSAGANLTEFKPQKGADVFLAILVGLKKRIGADKMHVLLAGPRRHWLIAELKRHGISYTFDGIVMKGDDYPKNILSASRIQLLTHLIDVCVVASRWEGGPRAVLETVACKKKIISTDVGVSSDILVPECIFRDVTRAIDILEDDFRSGTLAKHVVPQHQTLLRNHSLVAVARHWSRVYEDIARERSSSRLADTEIGGGSSVNRSAVIHRALSTLSRIKKQFSKGKSITIWGEMVSGPYGGASQVLKAVAGELSRRGFEVLNNSYNDSDGHILNSTFFDVEKAKHVIASSTRAPKVIHRIDGPISLYRGNDRHLDEAIFKLNREVATTTAFQCLYSWRESIKMGFRPVRPMIVRNASDPKLFYKESRSTPKFAHKISLVSSSWSTNMNKGFETYQYLDEHLDFSKYDYRFIGRSPVAFKNIQLVDAVESAQLGEMLRRGDVFIAASLHDPASNAMLEAINCGLPVVYAHSGGHHEFAWYAGLSFDRAEGIPALLEKIVADYESYRLCTYALKVSDIVDTYLRALEL